MSRWLDFEKPLSELEEKLAELRRLSKEKGIDKTQEIEELEAKAQELKLKIFSNLTPWDKTQMARHPKRPYTLDYINRICDEFIELHGDRRFADDPSIIAGIASINNIPVMVIGHQKGRDIKERQLRNFGCSLPEGYRKAIRLMKLSAKFRMPVVTLIDTPGAAAVMAAEERGIAQSIAESMQVMCSLPTPIIAIIIGEGGSGGAIAIGVGNRVLMFEYAIYSVISPEGCAAIIWRDAKRAPEAAAILCLTAQDLLKLNIIDEIIPEPLGGAHRDYEEAADNLKQAILKHLSELRKLSAEELIQQRYNKFRRMGELLVKPAH